MAAPFAGEEVRGPDLPAYADPPEALLDAAFRLLAFRQRGVEELRSRLLRRGFPAEQVASCLTWLEDRGHLDDEAFSRALVRERIKLSPRSASVMRTELTRKGIAPAIAQEAVERVLEEEGVTETALAEQAARGWIRRQGAQSLADLLEDRFTSGRERARARLYRLLSRRGFRAGAASAGIQAGEIEARKTIENKR
jgi:SOS response regulatory protein OraA/RecX